MNNIIDKIDALGKTFLSITGGFSANPVALAALVGVDAAQLGNLLETINNQPILACVPIQAEECVMTRQCDVGSTMLISQVDQLKDYFTDNSAPRPRTWTVRGYISSLNALAESGLVLKPSIILQQALLEAASESRDSVKFKTDTGEVVDVFIKELVLGSTIKGTNAKTISVTVQEVKILASSENLLTKYNLDSAGANSVEMNALLNLGGKVATIGTMGVLGVLLSTDINVLK